MILLIFQDNLRSKLFSIKYNIKIVYQANCEQGCTNFWITQQERERKREGGFTKKIQKKKKEKGKKNKKYARNIARNCAGEYAYSICSLESAYANTSYIT